MKWWEWLFERRKTLAEAYRLEREALGAILSRLDAIEQRLTAIEYRLGESNGNVG